MSPSLFLALLIPFGGVGIFLIACRIFLNMHEENDRYMETMFDKLDEDAEQAAYDIRFHHIVTSESPYRTKE